jgi:hypothetical protein
MKKPRITEVYETRMGRPLSNKGKVETFLYNKKLKFSLMTNVYKHMPVRNLVTLKVKKHD